MINKTFLMITAMITCLFNAQAAEDSQNIIVNLSTEVQLFPVYLASIPSEGAGIDPVEVAQLQKVLSFDLNHNGMTKVISSSDERDQWVQQFLQGDKSAQAKLKALGIYYVIVPKIVDRKASAKVMALNTSSIKAIDGLSFTGNINTDRRPMHQLSDTIYKALFNSEGVAATRFLYTVKTQEPKTKKWLSEVWEADYDGANARQITRNSGFSVTPTYVPPKPGYSSGAFFYVSYEIGQPKIYVASLADGKGQRFSLLKGNQLMPAVTRQRNVVAFICDVTGNPDLFIQSFSPEKGAIGKPRQIFATHLATQGTPTFSPDGKQLAFVSNKDGSARVYVMDVPPEEKPLKDIKARLVSKTNKESTAPSWSPDGTKLAYCSMTSGTRQIWMYDFDKQKERQLTQGPGNKENPTWAPDSLHLIFNSTEGKTCDLYLINLNQPEATKITSGPGEKRFPNWEPRG